MTREETGRRIKVMQHFETGGEIEYCKKGSLNWRPHADPNWDWSAFDYRPKFKVMEVTEKDSRILALIGRPVKAKDNGEIHLVTGGSPDALIKNFYFYNSKTKTWDDLGD